MNKIFISTVIAAVVFLTQLPGQTFPAKPISQIIIVGNDLTDAEVIERELLFSVGEIVSDSIMNESKNRLLNLWLFNRVEFYPLPDGKNVGLLISVTERLYIFPYPELRVEDRDWKKVTYGFGIAHENFRGRNEKLYFSFLFGDRSGFGFSYSNPWVNRDLHLTTGIFIKKYAKESHKKFLDETAFDENHLYTGFSIGKYWTRYFYTGFHFFRDEITVKDQYKSVLKSNRNSDQVFGIFFNTSYDTRDLYAYPSSGWFAKFFVVKKGLFVPYIDYILFDIDLRKYLSWKKLIFAARLSTEQSIGKLPFYDKIYLGFEERVRGHFFDIKEGSHNFVTTFELRFPILKTYYFDIPLGNLTRSATKDLKFGLNAGFFAETGTVWEKQNQFGINNFISGFGTGIHIILPYIEVLRIDLAFDEKWKSQILLEVEVAF